MLDSIQKIGSKNPQPVSLAASNASEKKRMKTITLREKKIIDESKVYTMVYFLTNDSTIQLVMVSQKSTFVSKSQDIQNQ